MQSWTGQKGTDNYKYTTDCVFLYTSLSLARGALCDRRCRDIVVWLATFM